jgi:2-polyprenyl-3-methyl-5-hydroxy-6-metoxy-1,4-benzoquinol methylase
MLKRIKRVLSAARQAWAMPSSAGSGPLDQVTTTGLQDFHLSGWTQPGGQLFRGFPVTSEDTLLDIGCGDGGYAAFSARQGAAIILADLDEAKLQVAQSRLEAIPARSVQILVTDANPIPLPDASVTKVVAMEVLEHVDDPASFMDELMLSCSRPHALSFPHARFMVLV